MRCRQWSNDSREFRGLLLDEPSSMIIHSTEKSSAILWYWGFLVMECNARWFSVITISHRVIDQLGSNHASVFTMSTIWFVHNNHYKCTASFTITDDPPFIWRVSMPIFHKSSLWYSQWTGYGRCLTGVCTMHSFHMSSASRIFNDWWEKKAKNDVLNALSSCRIFSIWGKDWHIFVLAQWSEHPCYIFRLCKRMSWVVWINTTANRIRCMIISWISILNNKYVELLLRHEVQVCQVKVLYQKFSHFHEMKCA